MSLRPLREVGLVFPSLGHAQHSCHPVASTKQCSTVWSDVLSSKGHCSGRRKESAPLLALAIAHWWIPRDSHSLKYLSRSLAVSPV